MNVDDLMPDSAQEELIEKYRVLGDIAAIVETMADDIAAAAAERIDFHAHLVAAILELMSRMEDEHKLAAIRELGEAYGQLVSIFMSAEGPMASYTRGELWQSIELTRCELDRLASDAISM